MPKTRAECRRLWQNDLDSRKTRETRVKRVRLAILSHEFVCAGSVVSRANLGRTSSQPEVKQGSSTEACLRHAVLRKSFRSDICKDRTQQGCTEVYKVRCEICNKKFKSRSTFEAHCLSPRHLWKLEQRSMTSSIEVTTDAEMDGGGGKSKLLDEMKVLRNEGLASQESDPKQSALLLAKCGYIYNAAFVIYNAAFVIYNAAFVIYNAAFVIYNAAFVIYNAAFVIYNAAFVIYNAAFVIYNAAFVIYNAAFVIYNAAFVIYNAAFVIYNAAFVIYNAAFVIYNAAFVIYNASFVIYNAAFVIRQGTYADFRISIGLLLI
eukprot:gene13422-4291_t